MVGLTARLNGMRHAGWLNLPETGGFKEYHP
jgi:hypothetical protein